MPFDVNGQFYGSLFGQDRIGQTTPDLEASEWLRPWLPIAYPAPYLPTLRQDQGHPKLAGIVIGAHQLVGQDKNGGLVPAGMFCGIQPLKASGGQYCVIVYQPFDIGFAYNPQTSAYVQTAGEYAVLAAPADAVAGDVITLPNGTAITIKATDIIFAWSCDLFTSGATGTNVPTTSTPVPISPVIAASTTGAPSTATWTLRTAGDTIGGTVVIQMGANAPVTATFAQGTTTQAATAINAALTTAGQNTLIAATHAATQLILTGTEDATVNGVNTLVIENDIDDIGTAGTVAYSYGVARSIGCTVRNVYQYIGGVLVGQNVSASSSATGINYTLDGVVPINFAVLNYMHEMGTAIQTQFVLKLPWIGATPTTLAALAFGDGVTGYQQLFGRTFTHFTGARGVGAGYFGFGSGVVASGIGTIARAGDTLSYAADAGNFAPYNPTIHTPMDLVGRIIGIQNLNPVGYLNRVRTLFDRPMVGPMVDPNPAAIRMGGSATGGIPVHISVTTDAVFKRAYDQNKPLHPEYSTHVLVRVNL
jgi:hypothetical protein